ncbi:DNA polymerase delta subunit 4 isoform X2 [Hippocampus comes]|uniref:DNA polymerase delta subunit 4 isoform X2 n=1 Tax=Hippocampus comes TaxID=109280 RepID=UPI00094F05D8|nr:PREDICTED: DNA polymerase delta subunit 4 isoform X2 [Hippocampus comes]
MEPKWSRYNENSRAGAEPLVKGGANGSNAVVLWQSQRLVLGTSQQSPGSAVNMTTKNGLITDSFKVVKKARKVAKRDETLAPPPQNAETSIRQHEEQQKLIQFDLDWRFGPSTGISRLQRWDRAKLHGLNPPEDIRELLLLKQNNQEYKLSLWSQYPL